MPIDLGDRRAVRAWNDEMAARYDLDRCHAHPSPVVRWIERRRIRRVFALLAPRPTDRVLEIGCGAGHLLARVPARWRAGVDLSAALLARARPRVGPGPALVQADAMELPFRDATFERVYCSEVLAHLANPRMALAEIQRVLRPGGMAVVSVPNEALIDRLKAVLRRIGLIDVVMRTRRAASAMPAGTDDARHLHSLDLRLLRAILPLGLRVTRVSAIPTPGLPLRYAVRCEAER